jgi:hypothetical protein
MVDMTMYGISLTLDHVLLAGGEDAVSDEAPGEVRSCVDGEAEAAHSLGRVPVHPSPLDKTKQSNYSNTGILLRRLERYLASGWRVVWQGSTAQRKRI